MKLLEANGYIVTAKKELSNGYGSQLILLGGGIIAAYNTGKCVVQGTFSSERKKSSLKKLLQKYSC